MLINFYLVIIMAYNIVEFEDDLQIVPSEWLTENNKECKWPSYTSQIKINKAIMKRISPSDGNYIK